MKTTILIAVLLLTGCDEIRPITNDQCLRAKLFTQCLTAVPSDRTEVGNWNDAVGACDAISYRQSVRQADVIPRGCR